MDKQLGKRWMRGEKMRRQIYRKWAATGMMRKQTDKERNYHAAQ